MKFNTNIIRNAKETAKTVMLSLAVGFAVGAVFTHNFEAKQLTAITTAAHVTTAQSPK